MIDVVILTDLCLAIVTAPFLALVLFLNIGSCVRTIRTTYSYSTVGSPSPIAYLIRWIVKFPMPTLVFSQLESMRLFIVNLVVFYALLVLLRIVFPMFSIMLDLLVIAVSLGCLYLFLVVLAVFFALQAFANETSQRITIFAFSVFDKFSYGFSYATLGAGF